MIDIIVYMGGCCGDLVSALIDWHNSDLDLDNRCMILPRERQRLKKYAEFADDQECDAWLNNIADVYRSVPSHAYDYHITKRHRFVGITVDDRDLALWSAQRFKQCIRPHIWQSVMTATGIKEVADYADLMLHYSNMLKDTTPFQISLESIVAGDALDQIASTTHHGLDINAEVNYQRWLDMIDRR